MLREGANPHPSSASPFGASFAILLPLTGEGRGHRKRFVAQFRPRHKPLSYTPQSGVYPARWTASSPPRPTPLSPAAARFSGPRAGCTKLQNERSHPILQARPKNRSKPGLAGGSGEKFRGGVSRHFRVTLHPPIRGPGSPALSHHRPDLLVRQAGAGDHGFAGAGGFGVELFLVHGGGAVVVDHALAVDPYGVDAPAVG